MLAVKGIYDNGQIKWTEPFEQVEMKKPMQVVVLFMDESTSEQQRIIEMAKLQESTGFAKEVLGNPAEDVWNDL
jgi:hypothetical protein